MWCERIFLSSRGGSLFSTLAIPRSGFTFNPFQPRFNPFLLPQRVIAFETLHYTPGTPFAGTPVHLCLLWSPDKERTSRRMGKEVEGGKEKEEKNDQRKEMIQDERARKKEQKAKAGREGQEEKCKKNIWNQKSRVCSVYNIRMHIHICRSSHLKSHYTITLTYKDSIIWTEDIFNNNKCLSCTKLFYMLLHVYNLS